MRVRPTAEKIPSGKITPCDNCPWRVGSDPLTIPGYSPEKAEQLAVSCHGDGFKIMACHKSTENRPVTCAGYVLALGTEATGVRVGIALGYFKIERFASGGARLYRSFATMLKNQRRRYMSLFARKARR